eukprot:1050582-Prorocentrum_minimum.AAC.4
MKNLSLTRRHGAALNIFDHSVKKVSFVLRTSAGNPIECQRIRSLRRLDESLDEFESSNSEVAKAALAVNKLTNAASKDPRIQAAAKGAVQVKNTGPTRVSCKLSKWRQL